MKSVFEANENQWKLVWPLMWVSLPRLSTIFSANMAQTDQNNNQKNFFFFFLQQAVKLRNELNALCKEYRELNKSTNDS